MDERTRQHRLDTAREGLRGYENWLHDEDPSRPISPEALGDLASAARWLVELLSEDDET